MEKYCKRLRDLREDNDLTQQTLADELGISQQYYSEYELGKREFPIRHLLKTAKYYDVSADYILGLTDNPNKFWK